jgi:hypothetical protein
MASKLLLEALFLRASVPLPTFIDIKAPNKANSTGNPSPVDVLVDLQDENG